MAKFIVCSKREFVRIDGKEGYDRKGEMFEAEALGTQSGALLLLAPDLTIDHIIAPGEWIEAWRVADKEATDG